ncbi:hypothetical protein [Paenibacillus alvei]|uniref:Uncharacterized protein n=1 Tax=Paenibacillus alvei TaxID=44250 RepID=A0A383RCP8_PAEAL|nr:hypothetical protein [Paenibacillus alvei]SYX84593.1 conserved exported protein of unknown function [Paenibacillus alvei]
MRKIVSTAIAAMLVLSGQAIYAAPVEDSAAAAKTVDQIRGSKYIDYYLWWNTDGYKFFTVYITEVNTGRVIADQRVYPSGYNTTYHINPSLLTEGKRYRYVVKAYDGENRPTQANSDGYIQVDRLYTDRDYESVQINTYLQRVY